MSLICFRCSFLKEIIQMAFNQRVFVKYKANVVKVRIVF